MDSGTVLTGRFRLDERLGRGAMGEVWRARDLKLSRDVAVKLLLADDPGADGFRRFLREAILPAGMQHPGIAVVHDADRHQGRLFIVTELLRGEDLGKRLARHPDGLPGDVALDFAIQLAEALAAAHEHKVIHRDLKPANLFVQAGDRLKICDFGLARDSSAKASITQEGTALGTPSYMSPEQWLGQDASASMDLYALGCILYEMLTGVVPFDAGGGHWAAVLATLQARHLTEDPVPPRERKPGVSRALSDLVVALLAKKPGGRPPDAAAVASRLRAIRDELARKAAARKTPPAVPATAPLACTSVTGGHLEVMTVSGAGSYRYRNFWPESGWLPWTEDPVPGGPVTAIAATSQGEFTEAILTVAGGIPHLRQWWRDERGMWLTWAAWMDARDARPFAPADVQDLAVTSPATGHLEVFALDGSGRAWHRWIRPRRGQQDAQWSLWESLPLPPGKVTALAAAALDENGQLLIAVADGTVHASSWDRKSGWTSWYSLGGPRPVADVACSAPAARALQVFVADGSGAIHHRTFLASSHSWSDWTRLAGPPGHVAAVAATSYGDRHQLVAALTTDGEVHSAANANWGTPQSHWTPWNALDD